MKFLNKLLALGAFVVASASLQAQNVQLHYDFGKHIYSEAQANRPSITMTVEQQSVDKFGDTFYFVDMAFQAQGAVQAHWKFLRNLKFWRGPISWHIRYDGGLISLKKPKVEEPVAVSINDAFFTGATYTYLRSDRKLMLSFTPSYKYIKGHNQPHNWELVSVWKYAPGNGLFTATGFISFWQEERIWKPSNTVTQLRLMTQPQFWLNLNKLKGVSPDFKLSIGSEVRISNNVESNKFFVVPTLALKWNFGK